MNCVNFKYKNKLYFYHWYDFITELFYNKSFCSLNNVLNKRYFISYTIVNNLLNNLLNKPMVVQPVIINDNLTMFIFCQSSWFFFRNQGQSKKELFRIECLVMAAELDKKTFMKNKWPIKKKTLFNTNKPA